MRLRKLFRSPAPTGPLSLGGHYNFSLHLAHVIRSYNIDTVIDVGANEGQFATRLRHTGFLGEIYSFEPVSAPYDTLLEAASGDDKWKTYKLALGANAGETEINVSEASVFSSVLPSNEFGAERFKGIKLERKETVSVQRLDEFLGKVINPKSRRILLKMDTQGFDAQVFEGAAGFLSNICALVSELSLIPIYHGMKHYLEALAIYEKSGFSISGVYPVTRNSDNLSLIEIDCVMVNQQLY